jgi:hypothetical protein
LVYQRSGKRYKENKAEQALQIVGHVVAESFANKRSLHGRRQFGVSNGNKSYLLNFRHWNYDCAFYHYYLIMEKIYKINESNILHSQEWVIYQLYCQTRRHWYADFSVKCQRNVSFKATVLMLILKKFSISEID